MSLVTAAKRQATFSGRATRLLQPEGHRGRSNRARLHGRGNPRSPRVGQSHGTRVGASPRASTARKPMWKGLEGATIGLTGMVAADAPSQQGKAMAGVKQLEAGGLQHANGHRSVVAPKCWHASPVRARDPQLQFSQYSPHNVALHRQKTDKKGQVASLHADCRRSPLAPNRTDDANRVSCQPADSPCAALACPASLMPRTYRVGRPAQAPLRLIFSGFCSFACSTFERAFCCGMPRRCLSRLLPHRLARRHTRPTLPAASLARS